MAVYTIAPDGKHQFFDNNGDPLAGGLLFVYSAGTTTKVTTYSDTSGTANANPIVMDSAGRCTIFLAPGTYKFVLCPSTDTDPPTSPYWTVDNIAAYAAYDGGVIVRDPTLNAGVTDGKVVWLEDGRGGGTAGTWYLATMASDSVAAVTPFVGIYDQAADSVRIWGEWTTSGLTPGARYYIGTAGAISSSAAQAVIRPIGVALSATKLLLQMPQDRNAYYSNADATYIARNVSTDDTAVASWTVFGNEMVRAGDGFIVEGRFTTANNGTTKLGKIGVGGGTVTTFLSTTDAAKLIPFHLEVRRLTSTTASLVALSYTGAVSGGGPTPYMTVTTLGTVDWTAAQTVTVYATGGATGDLLLMCLWAYPIRGIRGTII